MCRCYYKSCYIVYALVSYIEISRRPLPCLEGSKCHCSYWIVSIGGSHEGSDSILICGIKELDDVLVPRPCGDGQRSLAVAVLLVFVREVLLDCCDVPSESRAHEWGPG
eukprot:XP_001704558.1 Hypothetical protein GL50803_36907 [Giardia lamblia ATCC 50803]